MRRVVEEEESTKMYERKKKNFYASESTKFFGRKLKNNKNTNAR